MATLMKAAKSAGVDVILCPHCKNKITLKQAFKLLFQGVLKLLKTGQRVMIPGFGNFHVTFLKGRSHNTPITPSGSVTFKDRHVLRFKQSRKASEWLNRRPSDGQLRATKAAGAALAAKREREGKGKGKGKQK